ncbi:hypothetical protein Val02_15380 [Virgisporangium aliadipatigenens]|uniref:PIN domain-containing protein n=1 Tax=Virgisporangium aliadipatigenens TaxID=741659 RepID=A0A8J4DPP7_9ACTN|nr:hypothetical protein [Virgisporangium aliadipatigenens]GIJ44652.1 hypothetical protein Val02_15380 [Virgisporangium aliadipatigenens]
MHLGGLPARVPADRAARRRPVPQRRPALHAVPDPEPPAPTAAGGWVLDVSALVAFADATTYAASVLAMAHRDGRILLVPLPALAVAAARRPDPVSERRLRDLIDGPAVVAVDGRLARGRLFERLVDRSGGDRLAALVVLLATERNWPVLTERGESLRRLRPDLLVIPS